MQTMKKALAIFLAVAMVFTSVNLPVGAYAAGGPGEETETAPTTTVVGGLTFDQSGVATLNEGGTTSGDITLEKGAQKKIIVPQGQTLNVQNAIVIGEDCIIEVQKGGTINFGTAVSITTNKNLTGKADGLLNNKGDITGTGTITNNGKFVNDGTLGESITLNGTGTFEKAYDELNVEGLKLKDAPNSSYPCTGDEILNADTMELMQTINEKDFKITDVTPGFYKSAEEGVGEKVDDSLKEAGDYKVGFDNKGKVVFSSDKFTLTLGTPAIEVTAPKSPIAYTGKALTVAREADDSSANVKFTYNGDKNLQKQDFTVQWYNNEACGEENKISEAKNAGTYWVKVTSKATKTHAAETSAAQKVTIKPITLTLTSGIKAINKEYDTTTAAEIAFEEEIVLDGLLEADAKNITVSQEAEDLPTATFDDANAGTAKTVTLNKTFTLISNNEDSLASNYELTKPTLQADITAANQTVVLKEEYKSSPLIVSTEQLTSEGLEKVIDKEKSVIKGDVTYSIVAPETPDATLFTPVAGQTYTVKINVAEHNIAEGDVEYNALASPVEFTIKALKEAKIQVKTVAAGYKFGDKLDVKQYDEEGFAGLDGNVSEGFGYYYDGDAESVMVKWHDKDAEADKAGEERASEPTMPGTYYLVFTAPDTETCKAVRVEKKVEIAKKEISITDATVSPRNYEEGNNNAEVTNVTFGDVELKNGVDYEVTSATYQTNNKPGKDKKVDVVVKLLGEANDKYALSSANFTKSNCVINKIDFTTQNFAYAGKAKVDTAGTINLPENMICKDANPITITEYDQKMFATTPTVEGNVLSFTVNQVDADRTGTITIPVTSDIYNDYSIVVTITTTEKDVFTVNFKQSDSIVYTGKAMSFENKTGTDLSQFVINGLEYKYTGSPENLAPENIKWYEANGAEKNGEPLSGVPTNAGDYIVEFVITGVEDAEDMTVSRAVTIEKAPLSVAGAVLSDKTYDGETAGEPSLVEKVSISSPLNNEELKLGTDYTVSSVEFASKNVTSGKINVTIGIALADTDLANNYKMTQETYEIVSVGTIVKGTIAPKTTSVDVVKGKEGSVDLTQFLCEDVTSVTPKADSAAEMFDGDITYDEPSKSVKFKLLAEPIAEKKDIVATVSSKNYNDYTITITVNKLDSTPSGGGGITPTPTPEPEKPVVPEVKPDVEKPALPTEPPKSGANIGMDQAQQAEADKTIDEIVNNIVKPADPEKPAPAPQTEAEKETAKTEAAITEAAKNNEKVKINVESKPVEKSAVAEDAKKIEEKLADSFGEQKVEILQFANIDVVAEATDNDGKTRELGNLRNIEKPLTFSFQLPAETTGKYFGVARIHDGIVELLPAEDVSYDPITKKITFKTDKFSTYAVYETEEPEVKPEPPVDPEKPDQPVKPEQPVKPGIVKNVKVKTDNGLLKVTFNKATNADGYRVYVKQKGNDWRWYNGNNKGTMIKKIYKKALVKNGQYQVKVVAMNGEVKGKDSNIVKVYANRLGNKSSVMPKTKINRIKSYKGKITVYAKNVKFTSNPKKVAYQVSYKLKGTNKWHKTGYSFGNVKTVKGLKVGKTYNVAVRYRYKSALDGKTFVYSDPAYMMKTVW